MSWKFVARLKVKTKTKSANKCDFEVWAGLKRTSKTFAYFPNEYTIWYLPLISAEKTYTFSTLFSAHPFNWLQFELNGIDCRTEAKFNGLVVIIQTNNFFRVSMIFDVDKSSRTKPNVKISSDPMTHRTSSNIPFNRRKILCVEFHFASLLWKNPHWSRCEHIHATALSTTNRKREIYEFDLLNFPRRPAHEPQIHAKTKIFSASFGAFACRIAVNLKIK